MRALILFLILLNSAAAKKCLEYEKAAEYLETNKFIAASREAQVQYALKKISSKELKLGVGDINQARTYAYRFPPFEELGFGKPGSAGWKKYIGRLENSSFKGKTIGWEILNEKGFARIRLDYDPVKGAHYNIEIGVGKFVKPETHKLAISFDCGDKPCTESQVIKLVENL